MDVQITGDAIVVADFKDRPENIGKALIRSLRRGVNSGRAAMVPLIANDTGLKAGDVRESIRTDILSPDGQSVEGRLSASLKRLPLIRFNARQTRSGVSYRYGNGGRLSIDHAFIAKMKSGHEGVFLRTGKFGRRGNPKLEKIRELQGPSLGHIFAKHRAAGLEAAAESFEKTMRHELDRMAQPSVTVTESASA